ncbi:RNA polymerase recycling motor HelD [Clostridium sp.]|uniref:RNA polymerase recycling motor HelD n=1 Tax=Clostridium sp. TaxID=1506 RepID=UPI0028413939|nr:RNA polymerase recycling motor HelD [Clostridium sp.]MDR3597549.1 RNA polymerase recycling motor HelD [Clostridium sp.]
MNVNLEEERKILIQKKKVIYEELKEKKSKFQDVGDKLSRLNKEIKTFSEEKVANELIFNHLAQDIEKYEEALNEPYFGRVDFREHRSFTESIYIGKKGISNNKDGEEVVVDWRAPVADLYYSGTGGEAYYTAPKGIVEGILELKRKFLYKNNDIEQLFDEGLNEIIINGGEGQNLVDEFLKINLEENRGKKLKEVVATIQKEQNEIIRWPKNLPIIVQGSAGSGKTTIALHRLAYLIYRYKENMKGDEILVLAPNKLFLNYISDILPSLGADEVNQSTFEELVLSKLKLKGKVYNKDEKIMKIIEEKDEHKKKLIVNSSKVKGTLLFKTMLDRYIALIEKNTLNIEDIKVGNEILFDKREIKRLYSKDLKAYPINKRKNEIKKYLNLKIKGRIGELLIQIDNEWEKKIREIRYREKDSEERRKTLIKLYEERDKIKNDVRHNSKKELNNYFKEWKDVNSRDIYYNFYNDDLFEEATGNKIPKVLSDYMKEEFNENCEKNIIDEDDLAALAYLRILLEGIDENEKFEYIVVDEAQDYSPFQVYLVNRFAKGNALTLVGDLGQGIYYYKGLKTWEDITEQVFEGNATYVQLTQSYRSTVEIIDFAQKTLNAQNLGLKDAKPVLRHGEKPKTVKVTRDEEYCGAIEEIITNVKEQGKRTIAVITKDGLDAAKIYALLKKSVYTFELVEGKEKELKEELIVIPSYLTKGLEFDCTIILNPSEENYQENTLDERLLYVSLTRALHLEYIIEKDEITKLI